VDAAETERQVDAYRETARHELDAMSGALGRTS